ncbi:flagellar biosynthesis protein FlgD [Dehalobacter sp. DCM]|uniref:flagellar hook capping FlgD N-terminal domain-containing protein n=1 Tax=Dehalobacter sp. DCM TaxID=2907827 RepID=UPI0030819ADB|nr:flagellar biosynthesis protein FlgD [Dehalobacter sp. DCM]
MTVNNVAGINAAGNTAATNNTTRAEQNANASLDQNAFLKLLIAQLQNQDPMSPMDDTQFVSQMATFSMLEQMTTMASNIGELKDSLTAQSSQTLLTQGAAMIGKSVTGKDADGNDISGIVSSVKLVDGSLSVLIGNTEITLDNVLEVKNSG